MLRPVVWWLDTPLSEGRAVPSSSLHFNPENHKFYLHRHENLNPHNKSADLLIFYITLTELENREESDTNLVQQIWQVVKYTRVYPKVSGLAAWSKNCKW
jgi:hypothetical protein